MFGEALRDSKAAAFGYIPLAMAFGVLFQSLDLHWIYAILMSFLVYAGSAQFIAIPLLANQGSLLSLSIATFLVNMRHIFYGLAFLEKLQFNKYLKGYLIFGLTDESYAIICAKKYHDKWYEFYIIIFCHIYWVLGTFLGIFLHNYLNGVNFNFLFFSLVTLFAILTVDAYKFTRDHFSLIVGVLSYLFFRYLEIKEHLFFSMLVSFFILLVKNYKENIMEKKNVLEQ
ncbi:AzlC family ABC transporter permease [Fluviispira sanaruensis]|uniref:Branched-chain amino acid ABC transporter permease n=1 Tax=Fluviispira sanaruensis TaxID=2493639 RepID=A0A4P2VXQ1_FLUSA|nr:AzlC family ABC transporter permease [Fluviispira sanaruensis]BBH53792.1 branched-chain amino acid ABC transporter permease [Fluviispira sanaruensis]